MATQKPQSNREKPGIPRAQTSVIPAGRNPPTRPVDEADRQSGELTIGPSANFSKSPGSRE
jgi:hypothetical protein